MEEESKAEENTVNPLSASLRGKGESGEFGLWSNSMRLIDNSRYSEAAENLDSSFCLILMVLIPEMHIFGWVSLFGSRDVQDSSEILNTFISNSAHLEKLMLCINYRLLK